MYFDNAPCRLCYATPHMFSIMAMIALDNFQPPTTSVKQIGCHSSTEGKKIQYRTSRQENWVGAFFLLFTTFTSLLNLDKSLRLCVPSLFPAVKREEYCALPTSQGCCEDWFRFMQCFHTAEQHQAQSVI